MHGPSTNLIITRLLLITKSMVFVGNSAILIANNVEDLLRGVVRYCVFIRKCSVLFFYQKCGVIIRLFVGKCRGLFVPKSAE